MTQHNHFEEINPEQMENNNTEPAESTPPELNEEKEARAKSHKLKGKKDAKLVKAEEELEKLNDKYLRLYSDFENFRKRTIKEKIELGKTASAGVITTMLPVIDDLERAINAFEITPQESDPLKDGVILIYNKLLNILGQHGLEQMKTMGEVFTTDFHEAITNIPVPDPGQKGKVFDEVEKGYILNGKVIRFAKVVVGS